MNKCLTCNNPTTNNKFCSKSCSAKKNNTLRLRKVSSFTCLSCGKIKECSKNSTNKYCNTSCQQDHAQKLFVEEWIQSGNTNSARRVKRYLIETQNKCSQCGINSWNGKPITLDLEHIDGNSDNNSMENVTLLCPNCHSQTPTYKAKNKGKGRHARRQRYAEGKSF